MKPSGWPPVTAPTCNYAISLNLHIIQMVELYKKITYHTVVMNGKLWHFESMGINSLLETVYKKVATCTEVKINGSK